MKLGMTIRTMGKESTRPLVEACARAAEEAGLDEIWVTDHIAIPPDDAEGSQGRYLDPLTTLAFLAGVTDRIGIGTAILNLPYRPPLPTAKAVATVQELSGGRLRLGVGIGWMEAEFRALGVDRRRRGALSDATLEYLLRCFAGDEMEANGQTFYFRPRPERPPILVGGNGEAARRRALRYGDAWMPMARRPEKLRSGIEDLRRLAAESGREPPGVAVLAPLPLDDRAAAADILAAFAKMGVERVAVGLRYRDAAEFAERARGLAELRPR